MLKDFFSKNRIRSSYKKGFQYLTTNPVKSLAAFPQKPLLVHSDSLGELQCLAYWLKREVSGLFTNGDSSTRNQQSRNDLFRQKDIETLALQLGGYATHSRLLSRAEQATFYSSSYTSLLAVGANAELLTEY